MNWVDLKEYRDAVPDKIVTPGAGHSVLDTLSELNTKYGPKLAKSGAVLGNSIAPNEAVGEAKAAFESVRVDDLWIISIDKMGIDVRVRLDGVSQVRRINFMGCVETFEDACALDAIVAGEVWEGKLRRVTPTPRRRKRQKRFSSFRADAFSPRSRRALNSTRWFVGLCGCTTFVKHDFSRVTNRRRPNIRKTFPKHSPNTQSATSRFACDGARSLVSRTNENGGLSTVRDSGLFSRQRTSFGHVARSDSPRFFAAFVGRFQQRVDVSFRHSAPTRTSLPPCPTPTPSSTPNMCIAETRTARVAPKQRAARHEHAPRARVRRRRAGETLRRHRTRCEVRARRYASDTRRRPRRTRRAPNPAGTRKLHRARPPPPTAPRSSPSRRRAAPFPERASADGSCSAPQQPVATATRAGNGARAGRRHRALRAVDVDTRTSAETRRGRGGALAFAAPPPPPTRPCTPTRRHPADTCSSFSTQTAHRRRTFHARKNRCAANSLLARAGVAPSHVVRRGGGTEFSVTRPTAFRVIERPGLVAALVSSAVTEARSSPRTRALRDRVRKLRLGGEPQTVPVPDSNASRRRVCALKKALGDLHAEDGAFAVVAFGVAAGRVLARTTARAPALRLRRTRRARGERGAHRDAAVPGRRRRGAAPHAAPSGRFVFGHRFVKPIEFTRFWDTAASNRAAAPRRDACPDAARAAARRGRRRRRRASPLGSHRLGWRRRVAVERNREGTREGGVRGRVRASGSAQGARGGGGGRRRLSSATRRLPRRSPRRRRLFPRWETRSRRRYAACAPAVRSSLRRAGLAQQHALAGRVPRAGAEAEEARSSGLGKLRTSSFRVEPAALSASAAPRTCAETEAGFASFKASSSVWRRRAGRRESAERE